MELGQKTNLLLKWSKNRLFIIFRHFRYDPNSEEYDLDQRFNVVREANMNEEEEDSTPVSVATEHLVTDDSDQDNSDQVEEGSNVVNRGCISKRLHCTKDLPSCRTFTHRWVIERFVVEVFCILLHAYEILVAVK